MTTLAFKDGTLAADTMISANNALVGTINKIGQINGVVYGANGAVGLCQGFFRWVRAGMPMEHYPNMTCGEAMAEGVVVLGRDKLFLLGPHGPIFFTAKVWAGGSGGALAMGAMLAGKTAAQAVRIAAKIDVWTNSDVVSFSIDEDFESQVCKIGGE